MEVFDILLAIVVIPTFLFPFGYAYHKKLNYKLLFLFAVFGAESFISVLLIGAIIPIFLLAEFVFPQFQSAGYMGNLSWMLKGIDIVSEYWVFSMPVILLTLPFFIHKYYKNIFESDA